MAGRPAVRRGITVRAAGTGSTAGSSLTQCRSGTAAGTPVIASAPAPTSPTRQTARGGAASGERPRGPGGAELEHLHLGHATCRMAASRTPIRPLSMCGNRSATMHRLAHRLSLGVRDLVSPGRSGACGPRASRVTCQRWARSIRTSIECATKDGSTRWHLCARQRCVRDPDGKTGSLHRHLR